MINNFYSFSNNPISFQVFENKNVYNEIHSYARIVYVLSGKVDVCVHNQAFSLEPDNLIFINPYEFHDILPHDSKYLLFNIDYSYYDQSILINTPYIDCNSLVVKEQNEANIKIIKNILARFVQLSTMSQKSDSIKAKSLSYELLSTLISCFKIDNINSIQKESKKVLIEEILKYCSDNYATNISLVSLSEHFHFTAPYMSKLFKQEVGVTFIDYIQDIRLRHVQYDLHRKKMSAEELSEKHGFNNVRNLFICFKKKFGMTFSEYKQYVNKKEHEKLLSNAVTSELGSELNILSQNLDNTPSIDESKKAVVKIPPIDINTKAINFNHPYKYQIGVGSARELLDVNNQKMLKESVEELGFKYISFHGLLDDDMLVYTENEQGIPNHSFIYIFNVFDFILSINAKPIIELSYMPGKLARDPNNTMFAKKSCVSMPKDFNKWNDLIEDLFRNLVDRYSKSEVESWPIQVWSNPDTKDKEFGIGGIDNYIKLFSNTTKAIKKVLNNPNIELPKLIDASVANYDYMSTLFKKLSENNIAPSAINVSYFAVSREAVHDGYVQLKTNLLLLSSSDALNDEATIMKDNIEKCNKQNLAFRLSEWNCSLSHRNLVNDTAYKAPYLIKNVLQTFDKFDSMGYWTLYDTIETQPSKQLFHGGLGLYTRNGIKKSAYYGFYILSKLGNKCLYRNDNYAIFKKDKTIQVLLYNYHHINNLYSHGEMFDMSLTNRYTAFTQATDIKFILTLKGLDNGKYSIKTTSVNRETASSFDHWVKMGAPERMQNDDITYIKDISIPSRRYFVKSIIDNSVVLSQSLTPHEVCLIELTKTEY